MEPNRLEYYKKMYMIRSVEQTALKYFQKGYIKGTIHTCLGQEACAVGVMEAIDKDKDVIFSNHRAHGHFIAYGGPINGLIAEIMGKVTGVSKGIGGTQHLHWKNFYSSGIQGGMIPSAVGAAMAEKKKKSKAIVIVMIGDGTMGQGIVYECLNISALWKLPILFVLENNQYAQSTPRQLTHNGKFIDRVKAYDINTTVSDGNNVETVQAATAKLISQVRNKFIPGFIELETYRLGAHSKGDDTRDVEEIERHFKNDPLKLLRDLLGEKEVNAIEEEINIYIDKLYNSTLKESNPSKDLVLENVG